MFYKLFSLLLLYQDIQNGYTALKTRIRYVIKSDLGQFFYHFIKSAVASDCWNLACFGKHGSFSYLKGLLSSVFIGVSIRPTLWSFYTANFVEFLYGQLCGVSIRPTLWSFYKANFVEFLYSQLCGVSIRPTLWSFYTANFVPWCNSR